MSEDAKRPVALLAAEAPPRPFRTNYPEPFASRMAGRDKRPLGDLFGLTNFGVTHAPGARRQLRFAPCAHQAGRVCLHPRRAPDPRYRRRPDTSKTRHVRGLQGGRWRCPLPRQRDRRGVVYLEIGDRTAGDPVDYPDDDLAVVTIEASGGSRTRTGHRTKRHRAAGLSVRRAARRRKQADGSASSRGNKSCQSVASWRPSPGSPVGHPDQGHISS